MNSCPKYRINGRGIRDVIGVLVHDVVSELVEVDGEQPSCRLMHLEYLAPQ